MNQDINTIITRAYLITSENDMFNIIAHVFQFAKNTKNKQRERINTVLICYETVESYTKTLTSWHSS